jgi:VWFA-related protein
MNKFWTLPFIFAIASAQVELKVVATDHSGNPVTDLQPSDLRLTDDGSHEPITSLRLIQSAAPPTVIVLLDLMDLNFQQRGAASNQVRQSLSGLPASTPLHLYLLTESGGIYPVKDVGRDLDEALQKVNQLRPQDIRVDPVEHFKATYAALESAGQEAERFPGPKQLLWITFGIRSSIRTAGGWVDLSSRLRQLAAEFNRAGISIYTLDPGLTLGTLSRDGLEVLAAGTGGRAFSSSDLKMALKQMETDASATYLLDYGPPDAPKAPGALHTVRLSCTRKGVKIRSQEVYVTAAAAR